MKRFLYLMLAGTLLPFLGSGQQDYSNYQQQSERLQRLAKDHGSLAKLRSLAQTDGGRSIWLLTIGAGKADEKPALLVVGGVEGQAPLSTELAIGFAENLLKSSGSDSIRKLLERTSFYVVPNLSPDAMEQYFASVRYERNGNAKATDDDRDGKNGEDGYEDLDGNGKISWMRISSETGEYMPHPEDPRVMIKVDPAKPEKGMYRIETEGVDNDKDGKWNEDGEGGVAINRNMSFRHPSFTAGAGEFPVSEKENRALLDFLFDRFNVYGVVCFSSQNNLSQPYTYSAAQAKATITTGWQENDVKINSKVSDIYNKTVGMKDAPKSAAPGGDFLSWAYYHYGRFSFGTPGWWVPKTRPDSSRKEKAFSREDAVANYLRWAEQQGINNSFTPWKKIEHPDFPGQLVEVGGVDPFVLHTPPYRLVNGLVEKHTRFIVELAALQPETDLVNLRTEKMGNGLTRITVDLINRGQLPSTTELGERSAWVKRILVKTTLSKGQTLVTGRARQTIGSLDGQATKTISWLVSGSGQFEIEAGSPATGTRKLSITL